MDAGTEWKSPWMWAAYICMAVAVAFVAFLLLATTGSRRQSASSAASESGKPDIVAPGSVVSPASSSPSSTASVPSSSTSTPASENRIDPLRTPPVEAVSPELLKPPAEYSEKELMDKIRRAQATENRDALEYKGPAPKRK